MSGNGYLLWDDRWLIDAPWLDNGTLPGGITALAWEEADTLLALPTHGGTTILQNLDLGTAAPDTRVAFGFTVSRLGVTEAEYARVRRAKAKGRAFYWCPYVWAEEVFQIVNGSTYTLTRPVARGIVTGVTALTHPDTLELDGSSAPSAATVSGQTVTAADTGELVIRYLPVFRVIMPRLSNQVPEVNGLSYDFDLLEVVQL